MSEQGVPQAAIEAAAEALWNEREFRDPTGDAPEGWCPPGHDVHQPPPSEPALWAEMVTAGKFEGDQRDTRADARAALEAAYPAIRDQVLGEVETALREGIRSRRRKAEEHPSDPIRRQQMGIVQVVVDEVLATLSPGELPQDQWARESDEHMLAVESGAASTSPSEGSGAPLSEESWLEGEERRLRKQFGAFAQAMREGGWDRLAARVEQILRNEHGTTDQPLPEAAETSDPDETCGICGKQKGSAPCVGGEAHGGLPEGEKCDKCGGSGEHVLQVEPGVYEMGDEDCCPACHGTGKKPLSEAPGAEECEHKGFVSPAGYCEACGGGRAPAPSGLGDDDREKLREAADKLQKYAMAGEHWGPVAFLRELAGR